MNKIITLAGLAGVSSVAFAEVPAGVTAAISSTSADAVVVAGLMVGVAAALLVFKYIRRLMK